MITEQQAFIDLDKLEREQHSYIAKSVKIMKQYKITGREFLELYKRWKLSKRR